MIASDPWPLPWYLRHFNRWASGSQASESLRQIFTSLPPRPQISMPIHCANFRPDFFGSRPGVLILLWLPEPK